MTNQDQPEQQAETWRTNRKGGTRGERGMSEQKWVFTTERDGMVTKAEASAMLDTVEEATRVEAAHPLKMALREYQRLSRVGRPSAIVDEVDRLNEKYKGLGYD